MGDNPLFKRRKVFIKKKFQTDFSIRFLVLIAVEALLAIVIFGYLSRGTVIAGYSGSELVVARTGEYFLPTLLLANLVVIGVTAAAGFVFMIMTSHKIAGPLYRFEKSLEEVGDGDLTHRFNLRSEDQLGELAEKLNEFTARLDGSISGVKAEAAELKAVLTEIKATISSGTYTTAKLDALINEAAGKVSALERAAGHFKTTQGRGG